MTSVSGHHDAKAFCSPFVVIQAGRMHMYDIRSYRVTVMDVNEIVITVRNLLQECTVVGAMGKVGTSD